LKKKQKKRQHNNTKGHGQNTMGIKQLRRETGE
jgi:hypothetical protein